MTVEEALIFEKIFTPYNIENENAYILKSTVQTKFVQACRKVGIRKGAKANLFQQSFFIHFLRNNKITESYTNVSTKNLSATKNPHDGLLVGCKN